MSVQALSPTQGDGMVGESDPWYSGAAPQAGVVVRYGIDEKISTHVFLCLSVVKDCCASR